MVMPTAEDLPLDILQSRDFFECEDCEEVFLTAGKAADHREEWAGTHTVLGL